MRFLLPFVLAALAVPVFNSPAALDPRSPKEVGKGSERVGEKCAVCSSSFLSTYQALSTGQIGTAGFASISSAGGFVTGLTTIQSTIAQTVSLWQSQVVQAAQLQIQFEAFVQRFSAVVFGFATGCNACTGQGVIVTQITTISQTFFGTLQTLVRIIVTQYSSLIIQFQGIFEVLAFALRTFFGVIQRIGLTTTTIISTLDPSIFRTVGIDIVQFSTMSVTTLLNFNSFTTIGGGGFPTRPPTGFPTGFPTGSPNSRPYPVPGVDYFPDVGGNGGVIDHYPDGHDHYPDGHDHTSDNGGISILNDNQAIIAGNNNKQIHT